MSLTPKQEAFVREYLVDLNATQAAIRAGYSEKTAHVIGHENLSKPEIATALETARSELAKRVEISQEWVIERLVANAERAMQAEPVRDREGNETGEYVYQGSVANKALELLGKHLGMFVDRIEHSGKDGGPIETRDLSDAELVERAKVHGNRIAALTRNGNGNGNGKHP